MKQGMELIDENDATKIVRNASNLIWNNLISESNGKKYWLSSGSSTPKK